MNSGQVICLLVVTTCCSYPCLGQGMMEYGGTQASMVSLGSGLAGSLKQHGKVLRHSYQAPANASQVKDLQTAMDLQTKAIDQYMKAGCELEAKKKWAQAEESFKYVLRVIARRDGPGSSKSLPTLEHLVSVTQAQHKTEDTISYQKTVLAFAQSAHSPNFDAILKLQNNLANLYESVGNYVAAEPLWHQSLAICEAHKLTLLPEQRSQMLISYAKVLRNLKKNNEAEALEAEAKKSKNPDARATESKTK